MGDTFDGHIEGGEGLNLKMLLLSISQGNIQETLNFVVLCWINSVKLHVLCRALSGLWPLRSQLCPNLVPQCVRAAIRNRKIVEVVIFI